MANEQLLAYVHAEQIKGTSRDQIIRSLLTTGWKVEDINAALLISAISPSLVSTPPVAPPIAAPLVTTSSPTPSIMRKKLPHIWVSLGILAVLAGLFAWFIRGGSPISLGGLVLVVLVSPFALAYFLFAIWELKSKPPVPIQSEMTPEPHGTNQMSSVLGSITFLVIVFLVSLPFAVSVCAGFDNPNPRCPTNPFFLSGGGAIGFLLLFLLIKPFFKRSSN